MFCMKCGEAIPDGSGSCPKCGFNLNMESNDQAVIYAFQEETLDSGNTPAKKRSRTLKIAVAAIASVLILFIGISAAGRAILKKQLVKEWYDMEGSLIKVLDIDDKEIEYRVETGYKWMDETLSTYEWKVVSGNKIKIKIAGNIYKIFVVKLDKNKNVMTLTPALTSLDEKEIWIHID